MSLKNLFNYRIIHFTEKFLKKKRNGDTVLADLLIDNTPMRTYLKQHIKNQASD